MIFDTTFYTEHSAKLQKINRENEKALIELQCLTRAGRMRYALENITIATTAALAVIKSLGATVKEFNKVMKKISGMFPPPSPIDAAKAGFKIKMVLWHTQTSKTRKAFIRLGWAWWRFVVTLKWGGELLITRCKKRLRIR